MPEKKRSKMGNLAHQTAREVDKMLAEEEAAILAKTTIDWKALRPKITDKETFDRLMAAVAESTRRNENIAQLKARIEKLGKAAVAVAKDIIAIMPK